MAIPVLFWNLERLYFLAELYLVCFCYSFPLLFFRANFLFMAIPHGVCIMVLPPLHSVFQIYCVGTNGISGTRWEGLEAARGAGNLGDADERETLWKWCSNSSPYSSRVPGRYLGRGSREEKHVYCLPWSMKRLWERMCLHLKWFDALASCLAEVCTVLSI